MIRHRRTHNKGRGDSRASNNISASSNQSAHSPDGLESSPLDFNASTDFRNEHHNGYLPLHDPSTDYHEQLHHGTEPPMIDPSLTDAHDHPTENGFGMNGEADALIDPQLEQYPTPFAPNPYSYQPQISNAYNDQLTPWYLPNDFDANPFNVNSRSPAPSDQPSYIIHERNGSPLPGARSLETVRELWSTKSGPSTEISATEPTSAEKHLLGESSSNVSSEGRVDESYRKGLAQKLVQPEWEDEALPSTEFMVTPLLKLLYSRTVID